MRSLVLLCLFGCAILAQAQTVTTREPLYDADGKLVTEDMTYEELMDFSDSEWDDVEHGLKTPENADAEFSALTGYNVLDWLIANGDVVPNGTGTVQGVVADFSNLFAALFVQIGDDHF